MKVRLYALLVAMAQPSLWAQGSADPGGATGQTQTVPNPTGDGIRSLFLMVIFGLGMYFLLIAPQRKKAKEQEATLKALKPGDKVVTSSGILGVVLSIKDKTLSIRSADTKLEILKSSVLEVIERSGEPNDPKKIADKALEPSQVKI